MAKAIMVQGTMSNAGKSLLAAGLCRIFKQDGYRVAPFKSQNMALNSFITEEGLEMGRAQVMQAEAAGIKPSVLMNPILLKPTNDVGSQVIVNGEVLGTMSARDYFKYKKKLVPDIMKAYDKLASENDIIVIEGAGSPAEINLKTEDIVNMGMAKMAKAPVLLVGDIDRGGVFAQLIGTVELLEEDEREMVKGLIINKFRGDKTILDPGVQMLEERSHIPVVGVAPYLDIQVEDEDSLTERFDRKQEVDLIDIAVIRVPRISNFTDFNPLESIPGVSLRYVQHVSELKNPDMIILPGTKNTMEDLLWMRANGLEAAVLKEAAKGKIIFGICGGYQMLGETLSDPHHVEAGGTIKGMGLLPMDTVFAEKKTRTRVSGRFLELEGELQALSGAELEGYEIHMGSPSEVFGQSDEKLVQMGFTAREQRIYHEACAMEKTIEAEYEKLSQSGIRFVTIEDEEYPVLLKEVADRPIGLFVKGNLPKSDFPKIAIVGARACSSYGKECAEEIARELSAAGAQIVSGMAYGIDCCSQKAALEVGSSYAVLGGGVDICYPRENIGLYEKLIRQGGVISEMRPKTRSIPVLFPRRNRIISGICDAVIIIEARKKSGSLITAEFAGEQGRSVYAVPGSIFSDLSEGCHELIRNGAVLLSSPQEILADFKLEAAARKIHRQKIPLTEIEQDVYRFIEREPVHMEILLQKTGYPAGTLCSALFQMELKGYISEEAGGCYKRIFNVSDS